LNDRYWVYFPYSYSAVKELQNYRNNIVFLEDSARIREFEESACPFTQPRFNAE